MTNEQLSVLVRAWANRLEREIDLVDSQIGEAMPREAISIYTSDEPYGVFNPKNYEVQPVGPVEALAGLRSVLAELRQAEAELTPQPTPAE